MANRYFNQFNLALEKSVVNIFARVTFGSTGAPTLVTTNNQSKGVVSVTRNSAGKYTFVFGAGATKLDTYYKLLMVKHVFDETANSGTAPAAPGMYITGNSIATIGTSSIQIVFNAAGTATDPASTEAVNLHFIFSNSTAP